MTLGQNQICGSHWSIWQPDSTKLSRMAVFPKKPPLLSLIHLSVQTSQIPESLGNHLILAIALILPPACYHTEEKHLCIALTIFPKSFLPVQQQSGVLHNEECYIIQIFFLKPDHLSSPLAHFKKQIWPKILLCP